MRRRLLVLSVLFLSRLIPPPLAATVQSPVYTVPQFRICDPLTPEGSDARFAFIVPAHDGTVGPAPWREFQENLARNPDSVIAHVDLARCTYSVVRQLRDRAELSHVSLLIERALALLRQQRNSAGATEPLATRSGDSLPRAGVDVAATAITRELGERYPMASRRRHVAGTVFVDAIIDRTGEVRSTTVVGSIPELDGPAKDNVADMRFRPTIVNGEPVEVIRLIPVRFGGKPDAVADEIDLARFHYAHGSVGGTETSLERSRRLVLEAQSSPPADDDSELPVPFKEFAAGLPWRASDDIRVIPRAAKQVVPSYPDAARAAGLMGQVMLSLVVLPDGTVGDVLIQRSLDPTLGLDAAAVAAVRRWRFQPARRVDGSPVAFAVLAFLEFKQRYEPGPE